MEAATILAIADGALTILEQAVPAIAAAVGKGAITPEQQQALWTRVAALRAGGTAFTGPEWVPAATGTTAS